MSNPLINDLALFYGLYTQTMLTSGIFEHHYPYINKEDDGTCYYETGYNYFTLDYNSNAESCLTNCNPESCFQATNLCIASNCDKKTDTCIRKVIQYPLKITKYNNVYVDSKYDGSKWKLHKIIPFHKYEEKYDNELCYIFIFEPVNDKTQPTVVCFPVGEIMQFYPGYVYSPEYKIKKRQKYGKNMEKIILTDEKKILNDFEMIDEIIENPETKYIFCGHSMGCVLAQYMLYINWEDLEHLKKNCSIVGTGGYRYLSNEEITNYHSDTRISLYAYGEKIDDKMVVDSFIFNKGAYAHGINNVGTLPMYLIHNNKLPKPVILSDLTSCDITNKALVDKMHSWKTYKKGIELLLRKMALKKINNKTRKNNRNPNNKK